MTVAPDRRAEQSVRHPLAPLTVAEAGTAASLALRTVGTGSRLVYCVLAEPPKATVSGWDGTPLPREVMCVVYHKPQRATWIVTVCLDTGQGAGVVSATTVPGVQPPVMNEEWVANAEQVKADPAFRAASPGAASPTCRGSRWTRGPASNFGLDVDESGRRLARGVAYVIDGPGGNPYARPVENLVAIVDRDTGEVIEVQDGEVVPLPTDPGRYDAASTANRGARPLRDPPAQRPRVHRRRRLPALGAVAAAGLAAPDRGPGAARDLLRRRRTAAADPVPGQHGRDGRAVRVDVAEPLVEERVRRRRVRPGQGGQLTRTRLRLPGRDRLHGRRPGRRERDASRAAKAICLHEEDYGILWKHVDPVNGTAEVRRSRRLVVSSIATVSNYDYGFFWYFYLDGTIPAEVKLTGIIQTQAVPPGTRVPYANPVTPELAGPHHQHMFSFRLDMCLDGPANSVYEVDAVPVPPGPDNPYGNAFTAAGDAAGNRVRRPSGWRRPSSARYWKIVNHGVAERLRRAGRLQAHPAAQRRPLLAQDDAAITARATFATRHLWVTPAAADEQQPAGDFPNQHPGGAGLPGLDRRRPAGDRHRHRAVAHGRHDAFLPAGGLPRDAVRVRGVHAEAGRVLRPQPGHRPGAACT